MAYQLRTSPLHWKFDECIKNRALISPISAAGAEEGDPSESDSDDPNESGSWDLGHQTDGRVRRMSRTRPTRMRV